jgi:hypothetical protein
MVFLSLSVYFLCIICVFTVLNNTVNTQIIHKKQIDIYKKTLFVHYPMDRKEQFQIFFKGLRLSSRELNSSLIFTIF